MTADVEHIVKTAAFPVTLAAGVPKNYRVMWIAYSPADHPTFVQVLFANPSGVSPLSVAVLETSSIEQNRALLQQASGPHTISRADHFEVGQETVLLGGHAITPAQKDAVQHAMQSDTQAQALADFQAHLARREVLAPAARMHVIEAMLRRAGIPPMCACQVLEH